MSEKFIQPDENSQPSKRDDYEQMMREAKSASTQRKATEFVKVRRTSGEVEDGWTVAGQTEDGVTVVKQDVAGGAKIKHIPHGEFYATQKLQIDQMPQRPSGKEKSSVLKKFIGWGKKQKSEDQMTEAKESKLTSRSIAEAGLYTRDQVHIYKPERASDSETDLREAAINMAEAAALLYGRGIDGELPVRLQSGARESLGRIYMKAHLRGMQSPREFQLGPISAKEISDRFKNIAESIIRDHYPPELNRQIAFDGAMVLAHLLPHPGIEVNTAIRVDLEQMILRAQKYLHQEYA